MLFHGIRVPRPRRLPGPIALLILLAVAFAPALRGQSCDANQRQKCSQLYPPQTFECAAACPETCRSLAPGTARENRDNILACLQNEACKCARLTAGEFPLSGPLSFKKTQEGAGQNLINLKLYGAGSGASGTVLKTTGGCKVIELIRASGSTVANLRVDISRCPSGDGDFAVVLNGARDSTVRGITVTGPAQLGGSGLGGAAAGGIFIVNAPGATVVDNRVANLGYSLGAGTSSGSAGIRIENSRAAVECNAVADVAFGIQASNFLPDDGKNPDNDSSRTTIRFNSIDGAASVTACSGECSQGRAIKFQACDRTSVYRPLRDLAVIGNCASGFGGRGGNGSGNGSGLDLICGVQYGTFEDNSFDGASSSAQFGLQVRGSITERNKPGPTNPTHHNVFRNNSFCTGSCDDCFDVNFNQDASDQIGVAHNVVANGNRLCSGSCPGNGCRFEGSRPCDDPPQAAIALPAGAGAAVLGDGVTLSAKGVKRNSDVVFSFKNLSGDGDPQPLTLRAGGDCRGMATVVLDAAKGFKARRYAVTAQYADGNSRTFLPANGDVRISDRLENLSVVGANGPTVTVTAPTAGAEVTVGDTLAITWTSKRATKHRVLYSIDGGQFVQIVELGAEMKFDWTIPANVLPPDRASASAVIRVNALDDAGRSARSESGTFTIKAPAPTPLPTKPKITLAPAALSFVGIQGGASPASQTLAVGSSGGPLSLTLASRAPWLTVAPAAGGTPLSVAVSASVDGLAAGTYQGAIEVSSPGAATSPVSVPVTLRVDPAPPPPAALTSSPPSLSFTAPQGGPSPAAQTVLIRGGDRPLSLALSSSAPWLSVSPATGPTPLNANVRVDVSGLTAGRYDGSIRASVPGNPAVTPISIPVTLQVSPPPPSAPVVRVVAPNGGEVFQQGQTVTIQWTVSGATSQRVQYTLDGVNFTPIVTGLPGNQTSTQWTIPPTISGQAKIRVIAQGSGTANSQDDSDGFFTIQAPPPPPSAPVVRVVAPNGGEVFQQGQTVTIRWTVTGATSQRVQYTLDGVNFTPIVTGLPGTQTSTPWTIPSTISGQAKIRVIAQGTGTANGQDDSDGFFTIQAPPPPPSTPVVRVVSPNGGEVFQQGQTVTIQWTVSGATSQRVQYTLDGVNFTPIVTGLPGNQTSTPWTIPSTISGQAKVRVIAQGTGTANGQDDSDGFFTIQAPPPPPSAPMVRVVTPNGGEVFQQGQTVTIQWTVSGATSQRVQYTLDGVNFTPIVTGLPGSQTSTPWTIPSTISGQAKVRVVAQGSGTANGQDDSDGFFTIQAPPPPSAPVVRVVSPNGGEVFQQGQTVTIQWTVSGATSQRVQYTLDGVNFTPIVTGLPGNQTSTPWTIPSTISGQAKVRVVAQGLGTANGQDDSDGFFTIQAPPPPPSAPVVRVVSPNGGEAFQQGQTVTIQWTVSGATSQRVQYTLDGVNFTPIVTGLPGNQTSTPWTIPSTISGQAKVRVIAQGTGTANGQDDSDGFFTIQAPPPPPSSPVVRVVSPNGGEVFQQGQTVTIQWTVSGASSQRVQYTLDGVNFTPIVTGLPGNQTSTPWTIPSTISEQAKIRVVAQGSGTANGQDDSDGFFTIQAPPPPPSAPVVRVVSPNGGEVFQQGQTVTIQWTVSGATSQRVQYTLDGVNFTPIVTGLPGNQTSTPWTIPSTVSGSVRIRVIAQGASGPNGQDDSDGFFTIQAPPPPPSAPVVQIVSPNGGEVFQQGQTVTIQWTVSGASSQRVQYTLDGVNFTPIVTGLPGNQTSTPWTIPSTVSGSVRIRVIAQGASGPNGQDDSDGPFTVQVPAGPQVRVLFPNGGESFSAGQTISIQWTVSGATSQRVQYSLDGVTYTPIVTGLPPTQTSTSWTIPAALSGSAVRVRVVAQTSGPNVQDDSDGTFNVF